MRIAIMGSGGIGGYIGAKLAQASEDLTFLARGSHLAAMQAQGLCVESPLGEIKLPVSATSTTSYGPNSSLCPHFQVQPV